MLLRHRDRPKCRREGVRPKYECLVNSTCSSYMSVSHRKPYWLNQVGECILHGSSRFQDIRVSYRVLLHYEIHWMLS